MSGLNLKSSGGGSITLDPGSTGSNLTFTFPAAGGQIATSEGSNTFSALTVTGNTYLATSGGNVGIGTSSPATRLNVAGTGSQELRVSTYTSGDVRFGMDLSGAYYNWIDSYRASGAMAFATNNAERMRIDSSGRVTMPYQPSYTAWIGCTSSSGNGNLWASINSKGGLTYTGDKVVIPVTGTYLVTWQTICAQSTGRVDTTILYNGGGISSGLSEDNGTGYHMRTHVGVWNMTANDYLQFYNQSWYNVSGTGNTYSIVSITLIG